MTEPQGATPAAPSDPATGTEANEDALAEQLLADAVSATDTTEPTLGDAGKKAIQAEREARKALEKRLAALAPLEKLAAAMGGGDAAKGKTELEQLNERLATHEMSLAEERTARWRAEIAHEKGLTAAQARRLAGKTRDEMVADADDLISLFPAAAKPGTPAPDPSQGQVGAPADIESLIAQAQKKGDWRTVISLQNSKLAQHITK